MGYIEYSCLGIAFILLGDRGQERFFRPCFPEDGAIPRFSRPGSRGVISPFPWRGFPGAASEYSRIESRLQHGPYSKYRIQPL